MTEQEWADIERSLRYRITRTRNKAREPGPLSEKLRLMEEVKSLEEGLRQHRLKKFSLVTS